MPFRDVVGHRRIVGLLTHSIREESLPPSLIFAGPAGIGKRLVAVSTAQALNCTAPAPDGDACGVCAACSRVARGVHPDVLIIEPGDSGSIKIDRVRDIVDRVGFRPFEGRRRVIVIDDADALVPAAQNALLKTLEEPPSSSAFILVTSKPDLLLATVQSRCPRLRFQPLDAADIAAALMKRGRSETEARAIAATAAGSLGAALAAAAGDFMDARDVAVRVLAHAAAVDDPRRRIDLAKDLLAKTGAGGSKDREQLSTNLRAMSSLLRDVELLFVERDGQAPAMLANGDVRSDMERLTPFRGQRGVDAFAAIDRALAALDGNAGVKVVADWLVVNL